MFVLASKYKQLEMEKLQLQVLYQASELAREELLGEWNKLVRKINAKGGESFLNRGEEKQFDVEDIKRLIMLCHPDKHSNSKMSQNMTQKLLTIRAEQS